MTDMDAVARLRQELVRVSKQIFDRGLTSATSGNTSARVPGYPEQVLIKVSGKSFCDVEPEDFILLDLEGNVLAGKGTPSKETRFHLGIYKTRPEVQAIVHGHSAYVTAYVAVKGELPVVTAAAEVGLNKVGIVDFAAPGSEELAKMVIEAFADSSLKAVVLKKHGFVTVGKCVSEAFYLADVLEDNAKVAFLLSQLS